ncbi:MAG: hypothetical protein ACW981_04535 [Candidatus Hodarchaeales archaeon]|jgi:hypothetical protein
MITKIIMYHSSEGLGVKEVINRLSELGFTVSLGKYDYEYKWENDATADEVLNLVDKVIKTLQGCQVMIHFTTLTE